MFLSSKKTHIFSLVAASAVHGLIVGWSLMPSDPVVINKQAIQVSFVAPSANQKASEQISEKNFDLQIQQKAALKKSQEKLSAEKGEELKFSGKETSGKVDPNATAQRSAESEPVFDADYLNNPAPHYPEIAKRRAIQGKVLLSVVVKTDGTAALVEISRSSGSQILDSAALDAVKSWRFIPAKSRGKSVEASVIVPIEFKLV